MKQVDVKILQRLAEKYGRKYAGDDEDPSQSEVQPDSSDEADSSNEEQPETEADVAENPVGSPLLPQIQNAEKNYQQQGVGSGDASIALDRASSDYDKLLRLQNTSSGDKSLFNDIQQEGLEKEFQPTSQASAVQVADASNPPPPGYDGSPEANPNVKLSQSTIDAGNQPPGSSIPGTPNTQSTEPTSNEPPTMAQAFQEQQKANSAQATAAGNLGADEAKAITEGQNKIDALPTEADLNARNQSSRQELFDAYASSKIDPNRFYQNQNVAQKISSGIGLLLSGLGSGLSHQPNLAAQMMNNAIDRDIDAQKNDQSQALNLYKMNRMQYGDDISANLATKNQILTGVQYQLQKAAANAKGPQAQAAAQAANAQIDGEWAKNNMIMGLNATLHGQTADALDENTWNQKIATASQVNPEAAKDAAARTLPGVGFSPTVPLTEDVRKEFELNQEYGGLLDDAIKFQKSLPLNRAAITPDQVSYAQQLKQRFTELGTRAQGINRLNESEIKLANDAFTPGKLTYGNALTGLTGLRQSVNDRKMDLLQSRGIIPFKNTNPATQQQSPGGQPSEIRIINGKPMTKQQYLQSIQPSVGSAPTEGQQ